MWKLCEETGALIIFCKHSDAYNYNAVIIARDNDNIDHKRVDLDVSAKIF